MAVFDERPRRMLFERLEMFGQAITEEYEQEGKAGAEEYLGLIERTARSRAYLFDERGNLLAGREGPPKIREMAQQLAAGGEDNFIQTARTDFTSRRINSPSGKAYFIVSESDRPTGIPLPFWPNVWWAQTSSPCW